MPIIEMDTLNIVKDSPDYGSGFFDIATVEGQSFILSQFSGGGLILSSVGSNGALDYIDTIATNDDKLGEYKVFGSATFTSIVTPEATLYYIAGGVLPIPDALEHRYSVMVAELRADGTLGVVQVVGANSTPETYGSSGEAPGIAHVGAKSFLVLPGKDTNADRDHMAETRLIREDGTLGRAVETSWGTLGEAEFETFDIAHVGKRAFLVWEGWGETGTVNVARVMKDGSLRKLDDTPAVGQLGPSNKFAELVAVEMKGHTYVYGASYGIIRGYEIDRTGTASQIEIERKIDIQQNGNSQYALESFSIGDRHFLAAAGRSESLIVYEVAENGALTASTITQFEAGRNGESILLDSVAGNAGEQLIVMSSSGDESYRSFRYIPENWDFYGASDANDVVAGTINDDYIEAQDGRDRVRAGAGDDTVLGGAGRDRLLGQAHNDNLSGGAHDDFLKGGLGDDFLRGDGGNDTLLGGAGEDHLRGGSGDDTLKGQGSTDWMFGDDGNDFLIGGSGADVLSDGDGRDRMRGGADADVFVMARDRDRDIILDYQDTVDRIDISAWKDGIEFVDLTLTQSGSNVLVTFGRESLLLKPDTGALTVFDLSASDFILA